MQFTPTNGLTDRPNEQPSASNAKQSRVQTMQTESLVHVIGLCERIQQTKFNEWFSRNSSQGTDFKHGRRLRGGTGLRPWSQGMDLKACISKNESQRMNLKEWISKNGSQRMDLKEWISRLLCPLAFRTVLPMHTPFARMLLHLNRFKILKRTYDSQLIVFNQL